MLDSREKAENLIREWNHSNNYLVQELIVLNQVFSQFNESSVNNMRISSWRQGNDVKIFRQHCVSGRRGKIRIYAT